MRRIWIASLLVSAAMASGCGKDDDSLSKKAGKTVGTTATDFVTGVGAGVERQLEVKVELTNEATARGLSKTVSAPLGGSDKGFKVYLMSKDAFDGKLQARAYNREGLEIGRATSSLDVGPDGAAYTKFEFDREMNTLQVEKYVIGLGK